VGYRLLSQAGANSEALHPVARQPASKQGHFVSESTVYRILKAEDLITSPAYILMQASDAFQHTNRRVNEL
jgi:hypothetical protein